MSDLKTRVFDDRETLDRKLAPAVAAILAGAIEKRGVATLVVSGGSTPVGFFRRLSRESIDWPKVRVFLADERWVGPDHDDSNEKLVRDNLLVNRAADAGFVPLKTGHGKAADAEPEIDAILAQAGRFDLVVLGMGADGHTASLFPGSHALAEGLAPDSGRHCIAVMPPDGPYQRLSMTLPRLLNSRQIFIHITGENKKRVLDQAREAKDAARFPIVAVIAQSQTPVTLYYSP